MSEDATVILIMLFWAVVLYAIYLRVFVIRRLRKRMDQLVDATLAAPIKSAAGQLPPPPEEQNEMRKINERLRVLERIAVEKEDTLSREIEELRAVGR
jgi:hypothetical protein